MPPIDKHAADICSQTLAWECSLVHILLTNIHVYNERLVDSMSHTIVNRLFNSFGFNDMFKWSVCIGVTDPGMIEELLDGVSFRWVNCGGDAKQDLEFLYIDHPTKTT